MEIPIIPIISWSVSPRTEISVLKKYETILSCTVMVLIKQNPNRERWNIKIVKPNKLILSRDAPSFEILYGTIPETRDSFNNGRWAV